MDDLTLLYYTANRISDRFAWAVREALLAITDGTALISVSQKPLAFGWNICVGDIGVSIYNVYRQILLAAQTAKTPWVACVEDDSLYTPEHFAFRPPSHGIFYYNRHRWVLTRRLSGDGKRREAFFYFRERTQMAQCVCARSLLVETLEERFRQYPEPVPDAAAYKAGWGEPGRYERNLGLTPRRRQYFETAQPNVTFNHAASLRGRRRVNPDDQIRMDLPPWGDADALWERIHG